MNYQSAPEVTHEMIHPGYGPEAKSQVIPETNFQPADYEVQFADPRLRLQNLPYEGFRSKEHRDDLVDNIVAVGLPVVNYRSLHYSQNRNDSHDYLGSWGAGSEVYGQFTIYELLERQIPEERLATVVHEGAHANTPLRKENAYLFDGEPGRAEAEQYAYDLADQSLLTNKFMTGYHKSLAEQLRSGKISRNLFAEETQAIATELALSNRAKLTQTEEAQHHRLEVMQSFGQVSRERTPINLSSRIDKDGNALVDGIDKQLIQLLNGVENYQDLIRHTGQLKSNFYGVETAAVAQTRWNRQMVASNQVWGLQLNEDRIRQIMMDEARRTLEEADSEDEDSDD
jgi:hypothetical protein